MKDFLTLQCVSKCWKARYEAIGPGQGLFAFGCNDAGLLGTSMGHKLRPRFLGPEEDTVFARLRPVQLACAVRHSLALAHGEVFQWGSAPLPSGGCSRKLLTIASPEPVGGALAGCDVVEIACGAVHNAARTAAGVVYEWESITGAPARVDLDPETCVEQIAVGGSVVYMRTREGRILTYAPKTDDAPRPVEFPCDTAGAAVIAQVAAGQRHAVALTCRGDVFAWGHNGFGQLGDGTRVAREVPVRVDILGARVAQVAAGFYHTLALTVDGAVYQWGGCNHQDGAPHLRPVHVQQGPLATAQVLQLSTGGYHTLALTRRGVLVAWGRGDFGQLGTGRLVEWSGPAVVPLGVRSTRLAIHAGANSSFVYAP